MENVKSVPTNFTSNLKVYVTELTVSSTTKSEISWDALNSWMQSLKSLPLSLVESEVPARRIKSSPKSLQEESSRTWTLQTESSSVKSLQAESGRVSRSSLSL